MEPGGRTRSINMAARERIRAEALVLLICGFAVAIWGVPVVLTTDNTWLILVGCTVCLAVLVAAYKRASVLAMRWDQLSRDNEQ